MSGLASTVVILTGLLVPGTIWAWAARWPMPWLAGGVISALGLFSGVMALAVSGVPVTAITLGGWQTIITLAGICYWRRPTATVLPGAKSARLSAEWWIALPALPMIALGVWRALVQPLPGADVDFRWNHLATLIVQTGRLDYYPPHAPEGFARYFWADGIAPLVSSLYGWSYLSAGSLAKTWTALVVLLQLGGLFALLRALGGLWGGARAGWLACALGGGTMLLQFSFGLGQETGLTALGAGGMVLYLTHWQKSGSDSLLVPAAACAALAACAREYGLVFLIVGTGWVSGRAGQWKQATGFALGAVFLPAAWYLRNWLLTGNPLYAQDIGGLFRTNPVFSEWMNGFIRSHGAALWTGDGWTEIGRLFLIGAVPGLFGLGGMIWMRRPGWRECLLVSGATLAFWIVSVPYTAGGLFYSMRVLSPLLLLGCAWGGVCLARWESGRYRFLFLWLMLWAFGLDASLRAWTMPANPYGLAPSEWRQAGYPLLAEFEKKHAPFFAKAAQQVGGRVLSESAGAQYVFARYGKVVAPFWSPEVAFLFTADAGEAPVARLVRLGYTHILLTRAQSSVDFLARTGALERLNGQLETVMVNESYVLFALAPRAPEEIKHGR